MHISSQTWKIQKMKKWAGDLRMARIDPSRRPSMFNFKDKLNEFRRNSNIRKQSKNIENLQKSWFTRVGGMGRAL